ncbi:MAG: HesA/MoeB/ThiF family protein [Magnetococcus sp. WYHC-3]
MLLGMGGLGCPAALALARTGVEHMVLVDPDVVSLSNLQRQILFRPADVGLPKTEVAARRLRAWFPSLSIESLPVRLDAENDLLRVLAGVHIFLDGSDNFATRFLSNDMSCRSGVALVHGAVLGWRGQVMAIVPGRGPCLRCLFGGPPQEEGPVCAQAGVVGAVAGEVGERMAALARAVVSGREIIWNRGLFTLDAATMRRRWVPVPSGAGCVCQRI